MKLIRANAAGPTSPRSGGSVHSREWFREWIENQSRFVLLACGHKDDLSDQTIVVLRAFGMKKGNVDVLCERCCSFQRVVKAIGLAEYVGIKFAAVPETPLF